MDCIPGNMGYFLKSAIGGVTDALKGGETTVYTHTMTESASKPSLTIEHATSDLTYRYAGAIASGFKLAVKPGNTLSLNMPLQAKSACRGYFRHPCRILAVWSFEC